MNFRKEILAPAWALNMVSSDARSILKNKNERMIPNTEKMSELINMIKTAAIILAPFEDCAKSPESIKVYGYN